MEELPVKRPPGQLDSPLLQPGKLPRDFFGPTYFLKFYGVDRLWILAYVVSAVATPAARLVDERREGAQRHFDQMVWADFFLCVLGLMLVLSIVRAVDTPIFGHMHAEHGRQLHEFWAPAVKVLAVVNLLRPLAPVVTGDTPSATYSHVGGIFEVSVGIVALPYGIGVYDMTMRGARSIVREIEESGDDGKWVRVMRRLQHFRTDMLQLWSLAGGGLPWIVFIAAGFYGAYSNGVLFLQTREPQRAVFFFAFVGLILAVLYPLSLVTTECTRRVSSAALRWYPPRDFGDAGGGALPAGAFQAYSLVVHFLDRKFIGVSLLGFPITQNLLRDLALKTLLGLPSLYGAFVAVASHGK